MKTFLLCVLVFCFTLTLTQCKSGKNEKDSVESNKDEIPPSLQNETSKKEFVKLSEKEQNELKIETRQITSTIIDYSVLAPGVVYAAPELASIISTPIDGQVNRIVKFEGSPVKKGEILFQIQSLSFGNLISEYLQSFAEERFLGNRLNRLRQLVAENISSASELEQASSEHERASAMLRAAWSKLRAIGVTDKEIIQFTGGENIEPLLKIYAPIDGVIEKNFVEPGQSVNALEKLSRILNTRKVLIKGYLTPDDARLIKIGDSVKISKSDQKSFQNATITSINPGLDENSRSVIVNIMISSQNGWPKPGENVSLEILTSSHREIITIPLESLTYDGNEPVVFVKKGIGIFEKQPITVSEIRDKNVFVTSGLSVGNEVAVSKVFSLKALSRFDLISAE